MGSRVLRLVAVFRGLSCNHLGLQGDRLGFQYCLLGIRVLSEPHLRHVDSGDHSPLHCMGSCLHLRMRRRRMGYVLRL